MKRSSIISMTLCALLCVGLLAGCQSAGGGDGKKSVALGVAIYKFDDTFMTGTRNALKAAADADGVKTDIVDSQNNQPMQNDQIDAFLTKGMDALCVNPVDRTAAGPIITKAKNANVPVVFFNREPEEADMQSYDKVYYVGAKAEESGTMSAEIILDYFEKNPTADKNGDGKIQYILITGEPGHQDATLRSQYATATLGDKGVKIAEDTALWNKATATDIMAGFLTNYGVDKIEAVLANNDDMALGAIEALKAQGYNKGDPNKFIPVVGVDATAAALSAMENGEMLGTVLNDAEKQGEATLKIAAAAARGETIGKDTVGYEFVNGKYVYIPYVKVTRENLAEIKK